MNIPTAENLLANNIDGLRDFIDDDDIFYFYKGVICEFAKEFAAMHVEAALKEASENVDMDKEYYESLQEGTNGGIDMETILSAQFISANQLDAVNQPVFDWTIVKNIFG